jgi:ABC-type nitrate/sulfonate/bicarbonate transport system substrate-binding protein
VKEIKLIAFPGAPNLPIFAAMEHGYFKDAGVEINMTTTPSSSYQAENMVNGTFDIAGSAFDNVVAYQEGQGAVQFDKPTDLFAFMGATQIELAFITQAGIKTFEDVKGKTLALDALNTGFAFVLYEMLEAAGLKPDDYKMDAVGATPVRWESVKEGKHDGTLTIEPFTSIARGLGFNILKTSTEMYSAYQGGAFLSRRSWAKENPETLKGFIKGYLAGLEWTLDPANREAGTALLLEKMPAIKPGVAGNVMNSLLSPKSGLTPKAAILMDGVKKVLELRSKYVEGAKLTDPDKYIDLSYYNSVVGG